VIAASGKIALKEIAVKKLMIWILALAAAPGGALFAQTLTGSWQGSLPGPAGRPPLRLIIKITRADDESLKAVMYSIDQGGQPISASSATQQGSTLKIAIVAIGGNYEGKLNAEGDSIVGTWSQGGPPAPLTLVRATPATAWTIPEPPPPPKLMRADANPTFEVATIKPSRPDAPGKSMLVGRGGGNLFTTTNSTAADLITFAYGVHARQVTAGPSWLESEKFDITGKPDQEGVPNIAQLRSMVQKLLTERFQLTFHRDKKELSAYAITVAKTGIKLTKTQNPGGNLPGFGGRGPGSVGVRNATMTEFAEFLQSRILERPVVDHTELTDRFDFTLTWTPDSTQPAALGPNAPPLPANPDAPPDIFGAMLQQLGLKLESVKTPVEVVVIDKVEKPSEN
jgi:uncharacterized protein (TIGR03435 family)